MERFTGQQESLSSPAAMTDRVLDDARRAFRDVADAAFLERCAREAVAALWSDSIKVKSFVPLLALREIRDALEAQGVEPGTANPTTTDRHPAA